MKNVDKQTLSLNIKTPRGDWSFDFPKTASVQDVINAVIQNFGFSIQGKYELLHGTEILKKERPLVSYQLEDGDTLEFSDLGIGV